MVESYALAGPKPFTVADEAAMADMASRIYQFCRANPGKGIGVPYVTWDMDLRRRSFDVRATAQAAPERLRRWVYTPHMDARRTQIAAGFRFVFDRGEETYFVGQPISFKGPQLYLDGDEFERVFPEDAAPSVPAVEWDRWGKGLTADILRRYEETIYPRVVETLQKIVARRGNGPISVMDLGGGTGALAALACDAVPQIATLAVVERSLALVEQARKRAAERAGRMTVAQGDLTAPGVLEDAAGTCDVAILCGVVAQQVMGRAAGLGVVRKARKVLRDGGFLLVPSHSPALLSSSDYKAEGFVVHNMSLTTIEPPAPGTGATTLATTDFYILEKPAT